MRLLANYYWSIEHYGIFEGVGILWKDFTGRLYYFLLFHVWDGVIDTSGYIHGRKYISIGKNFCAGKCLRIEAIRTSALNKPRIVIKDNVSLSDFNHIGATNYIEIGNRVLLGSKCYITDHNHGTYGGGEGGTNPNVPPSERPLMINERVILEDNVWIGDNVTVLPGVTIGKGSIIGSNAVVSKSIPPYSIAVGIPARVIKQWNPENQRWEFV